ncbi:hypothetical protein AVEN_274477-1 [Araneus ventricosus]|uniref:Uncharacterized protein n=1 Tax=Araneus ventricosus TaxID=182803 RepID=A0A4Y2TCA3_ARAVE|nr:hypothetical protein AVEN_274477-1 [Araneus ventricosus]
MVTSRSNVLPCRLCILNDIPSTQFLKVCLPKNIMLEEQRVKIFSLFTWSPSKLGVPDITSNDADGLPVLEVLQIRILALPTFENSGVATEGRGGVDATDTTLNGVGETVYLSVFMTIFEIKYKDRCEIIPP